jgi:hypothetical protein
MSRSEASIHIGGAFAVAVLATTLATVSKDAQDAAGYTAAYLAGVLMVVVGATAAAVLLRPRADNRRLSAVKAAGGAGDE